MSLAGIGSNHSVERKTLSSQLYSILEQKVVSGEIAPGTRLSEESLADRFNVSRSPAREALSDLERVGLAVRVGQRDRMIAIPTRAMIAEKYDLWWILDVGRTYLCSLEAGLEDHVELRRYVDRMARAVRAKDPKRYAAASAKYYEKIHRGCANDFVNQAGINCDVYLRWLETLYARAFDMSEQAVSEHAEILAAFEQRDLGALSTLIRAHVMRQREHILDRFDAENASTPSC